MSARGNLLRSAITVVWLALIALTLTSWWLGTEDAVGSIKAANILILVVAFAKVRFVGLYFMELRNAPVPLRLIFEGWCVVVSTVVLLLYLVD